MRHWSVVKRKVPLLQELKPKGLGTEHLHATTYFQMFRKSWCEKEALTLLGFPGSEKYISYVKGTLPVLTRRKRDILITRDREFRAKKAA